MELTILTDRAKEDVKSIESITNKIDTSLMELNKVISSVIPDRVETEWSDSLKDTWIRSYNNGVQTIMEGMKQTAVSLHNDIEAAEDFSKE